MPIQLIRRTAAPLSPHNAPHTIIVNTFRFIIIRTCTVFVLRENALFFAPNAIPNGMQPTTMPNENDVLRTRNNARFFCKTECNARLFPLKKHSFLFFHFIQNISRSRFFSLTIFRFELHFISFFLTVFVSLYILFSIKETTFKAHKKVRNSNTT